LDVLSGNANNGERHREYEAADIPADAKLQSVGQELDDAEETDAQPREPELRGQAAQSVLKA
jgi:hypothetical protein